MRIRSLLLAVLVASPAMLSGQILRLPRVGRRPTPAPAPLPPTSPEIARTLAYRRSRWSTEGYSVVSAFQLPNGLGGTSGSTTFGTGTHGDYRVTDHFSATADFTYSAFGGSADHETVEVGGRYSPLNWDHPMRPFFDVRGSYMRLYDSFLTPADIIAGDAGAGGDLIEAARYSRGFGSVVGGGVEYWLSRSFAITTELSAMRNQMTTYALSGGAGLPIGTRYWMTAVRYSLGFKFNPVRTLHLEQKNTP
jgi:hypothetical protein